jgi:hypothetical protein
MHQLLEALDDLAPDNKARILLILEDIQYPGIERIAKRFVNEEANILRSAALGILSRRSPEHATEGLIKDLTNPEEAAAYLNTALEEGSQEVFLMALRDIAEAKGKQELYTRQSPQVLKALREMALVQSVESSNRIEGVTVAADRLRPLVLGNARPKDRSEWEITGYRRALNLIHTEAEGLQITPDLLRRLHRLCQEGSGDAGQFKKVDTDLEHACPGVSRDMIRLLLRDLKSAGRIECLGRGPGAKWRKRVIPSREGNKEGNN